MPILINKTSTLKGVIDLTPVKRSFFVDKYFPESAQNMSTADYVMFDIVKDKQRVAPLVSKGKSAAELGRDKYRTMEIVPPAIGAKRTLTPDTVSQRIAGEQLVEGGMTPEERAKIFLMKDIKDIKDAIVQRLRIMVRQVLLEGRVTAVPGFDKEDYLDVDYGQNPTHNITLLGVNRWNQATSTPTNDLADARLAVKRDSGKTSEVAFLGNVAWKTLKSNPDFNDAFNYFGNANFGNLTPRIEPGQDLTYLGRLNEAGLDLYLCNEMVPDPVTGVDVPFIPDDLVVILPAEISECFSMEYGAITQLNEQGQLITYQGAQVPKMFVEEESDSTAIQIKSRALPVLKNPDSVFIMKVI